MDAGILLRALSNLKSVPVQATLRGVVLPRPLDLGTVLLA